MFVMVPYMVLVFVNANSFRSLLFSTIHWYQLHPFSNVCDYWKTQLCFPLYICICVYVCCLGIYLIYLTLHNILMHDNQLIIPMIPHTHTPSLYQFILIYICICWLGIDVDKLIPMCSCHSITGTNKWVCVWCKISMSVTY